MSDSQPKSVKSSHSQHDSYTLERQFLMLDFTTQPFSSLHLYVGREETNKNINEIIQIIFPKSITFTHF